MRSYTVLRDLGTASTAESFGGSAGPAEPGLGAVGLRIDVEQLDKGGCAPSAATPMSARSPR